MVQLKYREMKIINDAFRMHGRYVLDFSNKSFSEHFHDEFNIDIYSEKYAINGDSNAKRLRAFVEIESSSIVIRVLKNLWEYRTNNSLSDETVEEEIRIENCFLQLLERIENKGDVIQAEGVDTFIKNLTLEELVQSIKQYIDNNKPHVAMDRLHTYCMKKFAYSIL